MNLRRPNSNEATGTLNRSRNVVPMSGHLHALPRRLPGRCEIWLSTFRGREVLYPGPFGEMTAGADKDYPIDYSHLNIQGYALGAKGLPEGGHRARHGPLPLGRHRRPSMAGRRR